MRGDTEGERIAWKPRPYQGDANYGIWREWDGGVQSTLVVMPTGSGKTVVAAMVAEEARRRQCKTLFLAHREVLINQAEATLQSFGLKTAIEMAGQDAQAWSGDEPDVVVATVQTLAGDRLRSWAPCHFDYIITDESHHAAAPGHRAIYTHFVNAKHLGITATPDGSSGRIGEVYKTLAYHYKMKQACIDGYLVPPVRELCKVSIDLRGLKMSNGDYAVDELSERISPMAEYLADATQQRIGNRFGVMFAPTVASSQALARALQLRGTDARYVAGTVGAYGMSKGQRRELLEQFAKREYQVIVCCELLFEGWDCPHVSEIIIARPTTIPYRFVQMVGRGTRPCPDIGKERCTIVDFDWRTEGAARQLVTDVDLWAAEDDELDEFSKPQRERLLAAAKKYLDEHGGQDAREVLEDLKKEERQRMHVPVYMSGIKAQFEVEEQDPLGVADLLDVQIKKRYDYHNVVYKPLTDNQLWFLKNEGVVEPEKLSMIGANKLISRIKKDQKQGLATWKQRHILMKAGIDRLTALSMTASQASSEIARIKL